ncbi:MAG: hypothetical protein RLZZ584_663 [Pseudomonadota bacterium]
MAAGLLTSGHVDASTALSAANISSGSWHWMFGVAVAALIAFLALAWRRRPDSNARRTKAGGPDVGKDVGNMAACPAVALNVPTGPASASSTGAASRTRPHGEMPVDDSGRETGNCVAPAPDTGLAGQLQIGSYRLGPQIGQGAMGRVYQGTDVRSGRSVAVKTLALTQEFNGLALNEARERFRREAQAARRLNHPDIVQVYDAGEAQDMAYIAMEMLGGHDLTRYTRPGQLLPPDQVLAIGHRIALALAHAHNQGVVHRDIKPANVMIDMTSSSVKVMDFGIAQLSDAARTRTGLVLGSPLYMSPEQLTGKQVDGRTDIYSLGLMLYQMLCGRLPFEATSMADLMRAVVERPAPSLTRYRPDLPASLADVIELALQKRPALRYPTATDLAGDLALLRQLHMMDTDLTTATRPVHEVSDCTQGTRMKAGNSNGFVHNRAA